MAKKQQGGAATAERGRLPGESPDEHFPAIQPREAEVRDTPISTLADLLNRAALLTDEELAAGGRASYQLRRERATISLTLDADLADPLRRMLLVLNRSNARIGSGALTKNVATKADAVRKLMELLAAEIGERASA